MMPRRILFLLWFFFISLFYFKEVLLPRFSVTEADFFLFAATAAGIIPLFFAADRISNKRARSVLRLLLPLAVLSLFLLIQGLLPLSVVVLGGVAAAGVILGAGLGLGCWVMRRAGLRLKIGSPLDEALFGAGAGLALLGALAFFLIRAFEASPAVLAGGVIALFFWFLGDAIGVIRGAVCSLRLPRDSVARLLLALLLTILLLSFVLAASPPVLDDELMYHLAVPQRWLSNAGEAGRVLPDVLWSGYPLGAEHLYTLGLALNAETAPRLLSFVFFGLGLLAIGRLVSLLMGEADEDERREKAVLTAPLLYAGTLSALIYSSAAYSESALVFYVLLSLLALVHREKREDRKILFSLAALLFASCAAGVKYTAWVFLPFFAGLVLYDLRRERPKKGKSACVILLLLAAVIFLPAPFKNYRDTGNPVFPYGYSYFGGRGMNAWLAENELANVGNAAEERSFVSGDFSGENIKKNLLLPFRLTEADLTARYQGQGGALGALWLLFVPLLFLKEAWRREKGVTSLLVITAGWGLLFFLVLPHYVRFALPALGLLAVLYGLLWSRMPDRFLRKAAIGLLILFTLFPGALKLQSIAGWLNPVVTGKEEQEEYLFRTLGGSYSVWRWAANETLPGTRILAIHDYRRYYAERPWYCDYTSEVGSLLYTSSDSTADQIAWELRARGIDYLFVNEELVRPSELPSLLLKEEAFERHTRLVGRVGPASIYRLMP